MRECTQLIWSVLCTGIFGEKEARKLWNHETVSERIKGNRTVSERCVLPADRLRARPHQNGGGGTEREAVARPEFDEARGLNPRAVDESPVRRSEVENVRNDCGRAAGARADSAELERAVLPADGAMREPDRAEALPPDERRLLLEGDRPLTARVAEEKEAPDSVGQGGIKRQEILRQFILNDQLPVVVQCLDPPVRQLSRQRRAGRRGALQAPHCERLINLASKS